MTISTKDQELIRSLRAVSAGSHDPDRPVGVVISDTAGSPLASGTNAPPAAYHYDRPDSIRAISGDPTWKYYMLEHAERNAILSALMSGVSLNGTTMYCSLFPCADCARAIVASGITRVVAPEPGLHPSRDEKWRDHYRYARQVLDLSHVHLDFYSPEEI